MFLLGKLDEVQILALFNIVVVDDDGRDASSDFLAELIVVLLLDLDQRVSLLSECSKHIIRNL